MSVTGDAAQDSALSAARAAAQRRRADRDARRGRRRRPRRRDRRRRPGERRRATARAPPAAARSTSCWSRRSTRATCCTTARPACVHVAEADLRLLAGDRLYAIGLARLVALGDTAAVAELADTITLSALAQGAGGDQLAEAVWAAGARAVGWGAERGARARQGNWCSTERPARSRRCAQVPPGPPRRPESRVGILCAPWPTSAQSRSPSTRSTEAYRGRSRARRSRAAGS